MAAKINVDPISGFPERLPGERIAECRLLEKIRRSFELFGFTPIETSSVERLEVLNAKNNGGIRQQIFRLSQVDVTKRDEDNNPVDWNWIQSEIALHFDLTVPLARYVVSNFNSLSFPFRRYQIQKVWRGEGAQQKRFREFYQCDIDIIGNGKLGLRADAEIPFVISHVFKELEIGGFKIGISNRGILEGALQAHGLTEKKMLAVLDVIDDLAKNGREVVERSLQDRLGIEPNVVKQILDLASIQGTPEDVLDRLAGVKIDNARFLQGSTELREVVRHLEDFKMPHDTYKLDLGMIRGLQYYTGTVYETMLDEFPGLSICSGGRYDNLAGLFSNQQLPGVGISIGLTRLFEYLKEANSLDMETQTTSRVLVTVQEPSLLQSAFGVTSTLRNHGVPAELYMEERKLQDQLKYADKKKIPLTVIFNSDDEDHDACVLKNMVTGAQQRITFDSVVTNVLKELETIRSLRKHRTDAEA